MFISAHTFTFLLMSVIFLYFQINFAYFCLNRLSEFLAAIQQ